MKLSELVILPTNLVEDSLVTELRELGESWHNQLDEGVFDALKSGLAKITNTISKIATSNDTKSKLNDTVLGGIYKDELAKTKAALNELPASAITSITSLLSKHDIKFTGVDLSRRNLNRIMVLKIMRLVIYVVGQIKQNGVVWLLSAGASAGLAFIVSLIMNALDAKSLAKEVANSSRQIRDLFKSANE